MEQNLQPQEVDIKYIERPKRKPRVVKVKLNGKPAKYFLNRQKGMNKKDAAVAAGYTDNNNQTKIEQSDTYQAIEKHYKNALLDKVSLDDIAEEHIKNIKQDKDRGAKNVAIKMALEKIEPEAKRDDDDDRVMVILRA